MYLQILPLSIITIINHIIVFFADHNYPVYQRAPPPKKAKKDSFHFSEDSTDFNMMFNTIIFCRKKTSKIMMGFTDLDMIAQLFGKLEDSSKKNV